MSNTSTIIYVFATYRGVETRIPTHTITGDDWGAAFHKFEAWIRLTHLEYRFIAIEVFQGNSGKHDEGLADILRKLARSIRAQLGSTPYGGRPALDLPPGKPLTRTIRNITFLFDPSDPPLPALGKNIGPTGRQHLIHVVLKTADDRQLVVTATDTREAIREAENAMAGDRTLGRAHVLTANLEVSEYIRDYLAGFLQDLPDPSIAGVTSLIRKAAANHKRRMIAKNARGHDPQLGF